MRIILFWQWYGGVMEIFFNVDRRRNPHIVDRMGGLEKIATNRLIAIISFYHMNLKYFI